jgi:hypothetical protein
MPDITGLHWHAYGDISLFQQSQICIRLAYDSLSTLQAEELGSLSRQPLPTIFQCGSARGCFCADCLSASIWRADEHSLVSRVLSIHVFYRGGGGFPTTPSLLVPPEIGNDNAASS